MKYQPKTLLYDARFNLGLLALLHTWLAINTSMHMYIVYIYIM